MSGCGRAGHALESWPILLLVSIMLAPGLWIGPSLDASVFSTVGWRLSDGDVLYAEIWDHKPPGVYVPYVVAQVVTDDPTVAWGLVWALSAASVLAMALVVRNILDGRGVGAWPRDVATLLAALGAAAYLLSLGGGLGETLALAPMSLAVLAAIHRRWLISGILAGTAVIVSVQVAPMILAITVIGMAGERDGPAGRWLRVVAGGGVALAVTIALLALHGGLGSAFDAIVTYGAAYRAVSIEGASGSAWAVVPWAVLVLLPLLIGCGLTLIGRRQLADRRLALACGLWLVGGVALIAFQGRFYAHYATPLVMPMALLTGFGLHAMKNRPSMVLAPLALAAGLSLAAGAAGAADEQRMIVASRDRVGAVAGEIGARGDDSLLLWGNDARLYEVAQLRPAMRYSYLYPLLTPGYATPELIDDVLASLAADPPRFVVDSGSVGPGAPGLPPLLLDRPVATDGRDLDLLDPLRDFVASHYELAEVVEGWPVYVRRD